MALNCLFIVQGEGRGHMTQALALRHLLERGGHRVSAVLLGRSDRRHVPGFFTRKIDAPVVRFDSPNYVADAQHRAIRMVPTVWRGMLRAGRPQDSLQVIDRALRDHEPDVVINFFEPLAGLYYRRYRPAVPMVCVGHQYMFHHPAYRFPRGRLLMRQATRWFTALTAWGAQRRLALSLYPAPDLPDRDLVVMPPLLRTEVFDLPLDEREPFFLVYLLNAGYARELIRWHEGRPGVPLHCFWDHPEAPPVYAYDATLTFHRIDDEKFLELMARCQGLASTAGFEAVGEAMYLGKPVQMTPVEGHFEQWCNAMDGVRAGAGIHSTDFEVDRLIQHLPHYRPPGAAFRDWVESAGERFLREIEDVAGYERTPAAPPVLERVAA